MSGKKLVKNYLGKKQEKWVWFSLFCALGFIFKVLKLAYHSHHHAKFHHAATSIKYRQTDNNNIQMFRESSNIVALYIVYYVIMNRLTKLLPMDTEWLIPGATIHVIFNFLFPFFRTTY